MPKQVTKTTTRTTVFEILETLLTSSIVLIVLYSTIAFPEKVVGSSMEPSFSTGERIVVDRISKHITSYTRGEVVVLHPPGDSSRDFIKRIVGVPGDVVKILDCNVYILVGGEKYSYSENYITEGTCTKGGPVIREGRSLKIPEKKYLVLGDNRENSMDSRYFGFIEEREIVGRAIFRFWPVERAGFISVDKL
jgi:signal peptidase I